MAAENRHASDVGMLLALPSHDIMGMRIAFEYSELIQHKSKSDT